jgi:predicted nucleic acid-binding protein
VRGRIDAFELSGRLPLVFIIPKEVADEIETGARAGYAVAVPKLATILSLKDAIVPLGPHLLDAGEATAIQLGY